MEFFKKRNKVLDLTDRYRKQQEKIANMKEDMQEQKSQKESQILPFSFFGNANSNTNSNPNEETINSSESYESAHEKKRKLAKRLASMTTQIEELSNQIYHLQQRIEVLEKKSDANRY